MKKIIYVLLVIVMLAAAFPVVAADKPAAAAPLPAQDQNIIELKAELFDIFVAIKELEQRQKEKLKELIENTQKKRAETAPQKQ